MPFITSPSTAVDDTTLEEASGQIKVKGQTAYYTADANTISGLQGKTFYKGTFSFNYVDGGGGMWENLEGTTLNATAITSSSYLGLYSSLTSGKDAFCKFIRFGPAVMVINFTLCWDGSKYQMNATGTGQDDANASFYGAVVVSGASWDLGDALTSITFGDITGADFSNPKIKLWEYE